MIDLENGLQFDEALQVAKWLKIADKLDPELRADLENGTASMLAILAGLESMPWLVGMLPGNLGGHLAGAVKALTLMKGLLDA